MNTFAHPVKTQTVNKVTPSCAKSKRRLTVWCFWLNICLLVCSLCTSSALGWEEESSIKESLSTTSSLCVYMSPSLSLQPAASDSLAGQMQMLISLLSRWNRENHEQRAEVSLCAQLVLALWPTCSSILYEFKAYVTVFPTGVVAHSALANLSASLLLLPYIF